MKLHLHILGGATFTLADHEYSSSARLFFALILRLALDPGRTVGRDELIAMLFPDADSFDSASHALRQLLYKARKRGAPIQVAPSGLRIEASDVVNDVDVFLATEQATAATDVRTLEALKGYRPPKSPAFVRWVDKTRELLDSAIRSQLIDAIESLRVQGNWSRVEARARECLASDPLNETATLALAEAMARKGSKERALVMLSRYRKEVELEAGELALPAALVERRIEQVNPDGGWTSAPFVGRDLEMSQLMQQWKQTREDGFAASVVTGVWGAGKSRLIDEFLDSVRLAAPRSIVRVRHCVTEPFKPFALLYELVPLLLTFPGAAGCDPALMGHLHQYSGVVEGKHPDSIQDDSAANAISAYRAVVELLRAISEVRACVICIDDSRALDPKTLRLFENLRGVEGIRLHLVIEASLSETPRLAGLSETPIVLQSVNDADACLIVEACLPGGATDADRDWIVASAGGNPAFLMSLVTQLTHSGRLRTFPQALVTAIDASIDALAPSSRVVLEVCAAVGDQCRVNLLADILDIPAYALMIALDDLERQSFLQFEEDRVRARSTLTFERVRWKCAQANRGFLHARLFAARTRSVSANGSWDTGSQWAPSEDGDSARYLLTQAWRRSVASGQPASAVLTLQELSSNARDPQKKLALLRELIEAARYAGNNVVLVEAIKAYQSLTTDLGEADSRDLALDCDRVIAEFALHADPTVYDRQVQFFVRNPMLDSARRAHSAKILLASADAHCDRPMAESAFHDLQSIVPDTSEASSNIDQAALIYHSTFGDRNAVPPLAERVFREAQRIDGWIDCPRIMAAAMAMRIATDDLSHIELLERAHGILMTRGMSRLCSKLAAQIGSAYLDDGEIESAQYWLKCATRHCREFRDMPLSADHIALVADLALLRGDLKSARDAVITMSRNCPLFAAPRFRMALLAYDVRLSVAEGNEPDDASMATISRWHDKASAFGRHDDIMDALFTGLNAKGNGALAEKRLRSYVLDERREVRPCNFMLGSRIAHLSDFSHLLRNPQAAHTRLH